MKQVTLTKQGGRVSMDVDLDALFSTLRNGVYTIVIKRRQEKRSIAQNALMWLWFTCIQRETGTPKEDVHLYYKAKFLGKWVSLNGEPPTWAIRDTKELSTEEMTEFLNQVQAEAATELGISLPSPEDAYWESFLQTYQ